MSKLRGFSQRSTQIYSVFGQCEAAAAELMIEKHGCHKIERAEIPRSALFNEQGAIAKFAIVVPPDKQRIFHELCVRLRS